MLDHIHLKEFRRLRVPHRGYQRIVAHCHKGCDCRSVFVWHEEGGGYRCRSCHGYFEVNYALIDEEKPAQRNVSRRDVDQQIA